MAGALVSMVMEKIGEALVSKVMEKLGEEVSSVGGAQAELEKISSTFESIQALLNDAEIIQFHNQSMQVWLKKLKDVAYDVEDLLDEMIPWPEPESRTDDGGDRQRKGKRKRFSFLGDEMQTFVSKVASQRDFACQIKEVRAKLDQIAADTSKFSFQLNHSFRGGSELHKVNSQTSSLIDESKMFGRDIDKDIIISKLVSGSSSEERGIHVISIVGFGGLGKTTLAQLICNDERVTSHFRKQVLWVCVSDDFNVINLTKAIIKAAGGTSPPDSHLDSLQKQLMETLQDKLFLLVLDDVWNDDSERWERLWLSLQTGAPGSKILVTTRSEKVANTCRDSAYMHKLEGLSDDDCWLLFTSRAFAGRKVEDCPALEKIGREIVKKCKGVPLSLKVIGSVMRSKRKAHDWQDILESETWEIRDIAKGILPALLLSYYNLPVHLKQCFAYCSVFPKDYQMKKDRLVKLWLAQGFIKPDGKREMEAIGGEYFDDLLAQSLFQKVVIESEHEEEEGICTIHDLLHDLIQFITKNECCIFENGKSDISSVLTVRHSSFIATGKTSHIPAPLCHAKKLRTLHQIRESTILTIPGNLFQCARSLRTLDFIGTSADRSIGFIGWGRGIKELPSSIGLLKHLRYLDLSYTLIVELPESVSSLRNMQTLKLNWCQLLKRLPSGMSAMVRLRHLEIYGTWRLEYLPEGLGRITSLRTLSRFIVGGDGGCKIGELKLLDSLQGKLIIDHLERVGSMDEAKEAQLENKLHIRMLTLKMFEIDEELPDDDLEICESDEVLPDDEVSGDDEVERMDNVLEALPDDDDEVLPDDEVSGDDEVERMDDVLEALRPPHTNLEKLVIERCIGSKFPTWMEDLPFSNLVDLRLIGCNKCTQLPGLGRLPSLKYLEITARLVKRVGSEFYGNSSGGGINRVAFPKLETLDFDYMDELEEWESRLEDREIMPSLHSLAISDCSKLRSLPDDLGHLKSLRDLLIFSCPELLSLPQGLHGLTSLTINYSPMLAERCRGEDWSNISHIPNIIIDFKRII